MSKALTRLRHAASVALMAKLDYIGAVGTPWPDPFRGPVHLQFHWATVDGVPECVGLDVHLFREGRDGRKETFPGSKPQAITATLFRQLPVAHLIEEMMRQYSDLLRHTSGAEGANPNAKKAAGRALPAFEQRASRRTGATLYWTRDRLEEVAVIYRDALAGKQPPTQAVAERFSLSHSMAAKLVRRCRDEGLLGQTRQGKSGGAVAPKKRKRG